VAVFPAAVKDAVDPYLAIHNFVKNQILAFDKNAIATSLKMFISRYDTHFGELF
jgi:hypothetical protein